MSVKLLTEHHLEILSLKGGCTGSSESTLVKIPHCWNHMSWLIFVSATLTTTVHYDSYNIFMKQIATVLPAKSDSDFMFCS